MLVSMRRSAAAVLMLQATLILVRAANTDEKTTDELTPPLSANKGFGSDSDEARLETDVESTVTPTRASMRPAPPGGVLTRAGDDALLTCVVTGARGQDVAWRRARDARQLTSGNARVTDDDRIFVMHDDSDEPARGAVGIPRGGDVWALVVRDVRPADSGLYVCELKAPNTPTLKTFHKLTVISRGLTPPESVNGTSDSYSANASPVSPLARAHNYTACCAAANVTRSCRGFCSIQTILEGSTGQDPENCEHDFPAIVKCMADGRNHVPCCIQEHVPDICRDVCRGEYTAITDNIKTHFSCAAYTEETLACIVEGIAILPSAPENVEVEPLNEKQLRVSWSLPIAKAETITQYLINVTRLRSFDAPRIAPSDSTVRNASNTIDSQNKLIKVSALANSTVLNDLLPFTMYEITVTSLNIHGTSLPSYAVRSLTMTPSPDRVSPWGAASAPPLPDIRQCCLDANVTEPSCLHKLCDPTYTFHMEVVDLMICAPWAGATFRCLANGRDHSPCCRARGLPNACLPLCTGNVTTIDFNYFKCLRYMSSYTNCLLSGYGVLAGAPSRLHVTNIGENYAVALWSAPAVLADTVTHYNLHYRRAPDRDDEAHDDYTLIDKITDTRYILEDLDSNTDYEVYVEAVNEHGVGEPSSRIIFRTQSELIDEEIEEALTYNISECCSRASVASVCMPLCSYDASMSDLRLLASLCTHDFHKLLRCGAGGRNHESCCTRRGVPTACRPLCSGVMVGSVLATANTCVPYIGNIVQCFEEGTGLLPGPPREVHAIRVSDDEVWLQWSAPSDGANATHYVVHYQQLTNTTAPYYYNTLELENNKNASDTFATISGLETHTLYHMFVVSVNEHGTSLPSSILVLNITEVMGASNVSGVASPPHSLGVSGHSATWVAISWQPPQFSLADEKITYTLHHKTPGESEFMHVDTTVPSHLLEKLTPNTQYIVFVTATTDAGTSAPSETLVAWTDPAYPAFVEPPTVHPVNLVVEGSSMTILCIAMGTPMPTISLYISGRLVRQETTRHMVTVISNVTRDMDQISCYADNGYGTPMQASRKITISHVPTIQASGITMAAAGESVTLECRVEALPRPNFAFWRDQQGRVPVIEGPKYTIQIVADGEEATKYTMRLTINTISEPDVGDYFCHADNAFGTAVRPVSVRLRGSAPQQNVTQCCQQQNVSSACIDACGFYLDMDSIIDRPECLSDFDKLMKCAADGSDHRSCCASWGVPRSCLELCRGGQATRTCAIQHARRALACFREGGARLPGPPRELRVAPHDTLHHAVVVSWEPPSKNPGSVELYRVFWRPLGARSPDKLDTPDNSAVLSGLRDGVLYECVVKAGNHLGTSTLTEPIRFTATGLSELSAASSPVSGEGGEGGGAGAAVGGALAFLLVAAVLIAAVFFYRYRRNLKMKSQGGVAFENPSYLREPNTEIPNGAADGATRSNGAPATAVSSSAAWRLELPTSGSAGGAGHIAAGTEVDPSLYEELKLGHDGAGFKRLMP